MMSRSCNCAISFGGRGNESCTCGPRPSREGQSMPCHTFILSVCLLGVDSIMASLAWKRNVIQAPRDARGSSESHHW